MLLWYWQYVISVNRTSTEQRAIDPAKIKRDCLIAGFEPVGHASLCPTYVNFLTFWTVFNPGQPWPDQ